MVGAAVSHPSVRSEQPGLLAGQGCGPERHCPPRSEGAGWAPGRCWPKKAAIRAQT